MFTGIVQDLGRIRSIEPLDEGKRIAVQTAVDTSGLEMGESIAISGACMTVVEWAEDWFAFDVSSESLRRTTLGTFSVGDTVNIERSMKLSDRIGGHLVSGHVDGTGTVRSIEAEGESSIYTFEIPAELASRAIEKGSIAIDGISLTCFNLTNDSVDVAVIPHTMSVTTLGSKEPGSPINVESDLLGKYVERLLDPHLKR